MSRSIASLFNTLGVNKVRVLNLVIDGRLRGLINSFLATLLSGTDCTRFNGIGVNFVIDFQRPIPCPSRCEKLRRLWKSTLRGPCLDRFLNAAGDCAKGG
jgi:hypothetical protein